MEKINIFIKQFGILILIGVVGIGILGYGMWGQLMPRKPVVEIIKNNPSRSDLVGSDNGLQPTRSDLLVTVDVAGAVEKPGVYKLPNGSRIGDTLVMAGGLSANADREWVAKNLNLAEQVKDGGKIYIPSVNIARETPLQNNGKGVTLGIATININTASLGELDSLTGIGEVRAKQIMDNRPYGNKEELLSKAKIPQSVYDKIKDLISIY